MSKSIKQLAERFYELVNSGGDLSEVLSKDGMLNTYKHYCDTAILSIALDHKVPQ